ncbi:MAG: ribosome maturation factor RimP [Clostridia bacterium]|nr:ribosome maturation factor RimP [Candidatus Limimonas egerieequi]MCQ2489551.1 ribosome maturation factor RimP [Clostridia bacterium]
MAGKVETKVLEIAEPIARDLGLSIWDIEFVKEGADHYLRIYIDKEGGVGIDDCVDMSHAIDGPLDDADPIDVSYTLEVSSPGAERSLKTDAHFMAYIGEKVMVKLIRPVDGEREFRGILKGYDKGQVVFESNEGKSLSFNKKEASYIKVDDFDEF